MKTSALGPNEQAMVEAFGASESRMTQAQGALSALDENASETQIFHAQKAIEKEVRIMSALANLSQTLHNMLMKLIEKLNIR